jgi:hypothetical protein
MKKIKIKHAVLTTLLLILVVPVFNTANLYGRYSELTGMEKDIARYFLGITLEISIFVCVKAGYRPAGIFFAFLSLLIGLLYHVRFDDVRYFNYWYTHQFIVAVLIQTGISSAVYFLSELYVSLIRKEQDFQLWSETKKKIEQDNLELKNIIAQLRVGNSQLEIIEHKEKIATSNLTHAQQEYNKIKQEIASLKKAKANASRGVTHDNN